MKHRKNNGLVIYASFSLYFNFMCIWFYLGRKKSKISALGNISYLYFILTWFRKARSTGNILFDRLYLWPFKYYNDVIRVSGNYRTKTENWLWQSKTNLIMFLLSSVLPKHFSLLLLHKCIMYNVYIEKLLLT
jgi:hypothetical protein